MHYDTHLAMKILMDLFWVCLLCLVVTAPRLFNCLAFRRFEKTPDGRGLYNFY